MFGLRKRKRFERVASLELPPGQWERAWTSLRRRDVLGRIGLALLAALVTCAVIHGWDPPFAYRKGYTPSRDIVATVKFTKFDPDATRDARELARSQTRYIYRLDATPLVQLRAELRNKLSEVAGAPSLDKLDPKLWADFQMPLADGAKPPTAKEAEEQFVEFRAAFTPQEQLERVADAIGQALDPFEKRGLLDKLSENLGTGNKEEISVYPLGHLDAKRNIPVSEVQIGDGTAILDSLRRQPDLVPVADRLFAWLLPRLKRLKPTLTVDDDATKEAMDNAVTSEADKFVTFTEGQSTLVKARQPLDDEQIDLLKLEYAAAMDARPLHFKISRATAITGLVFVAFLLCGIHMRYRQRGPLASLTRLVVLLFLAIATVALACWGGEVWRGELVPVLLFGMTMAIVYRQELALLLACVVAMIVVLAVGHGFREFLLLMGTTTAAVLNLGRIRTRSKLIDVGLFAGVVAVVLYVAMGMLDDQPLSWALFKDACINGLWAVAAGFLATGLLPFIEHAFGVLTDLSLLELGDVAHPLLQELVRRAPSTYNHSVTVGSIAEAAAESIHARGLLVRVGAYFHDIGKMLKPGYFIENQGPDEGNRHETLVPAMSTLVIIAHIKDGADLARQHRLPQPIVDLIAQHHGTTRVEFFFGRATEQQLADPNSAEVDESSYRYPGPKPQTKEAAVLMLADAVESASRTLVDPTPARIESLVREIAEHRLHGGQFDESGLTLRELRTIEKSMVVSLTSIYHGRIKYPEQRTA